MMTLSLAACGDSNPGGGKAETTDSEETISGDIRYAFWDAAQQPYLEQCVKEFNKIYPDIKVTLEPNVWDEYWTKLEEVLQTYFG